MHKTWHLFSIQDSKEIGKLRAHFVWKEKKKKIHSLKAKSHKKTYTSSVFAPYISLVISCSRTNHPKT